MVQVTAAVIRRRGRVLVAKRRAEFRFGGLWEFPGGKVEPGEEPRRGLERELAEELGVPARIGRFLCSIPYDGPGLEIELLVFEAEVPDTGLRLSDHDEIRWLRPSEMDETVFTEPDRPVVRMLASGPGDAA